MKHVFAKKKNKLRYESKVHLLHIIPTYNLLRYPFTNSHSVGPLSLMERLKSAGRFSVHMCE